MIESSSQWIIGERAQNAPFLPFYEWLYRHVISKPGVIQKLQDIWLSWKIIAYILALVLCVAIIYLAIRISQIRKAQQEHLKKLTLESLQHTGGVVNEKWTRIQQLTESGNENDWKQGVLEADVLLDEMMTAMGYTQDTLGEKLKAVEKSDFTSIDKAWEAHKVRNLIAHQGSNVDISHREIRRVIQLYKEVFEEFQYI